MGNQMRAKMAVISKRSHIPFFPIFLVVMNAKRILGQFGNMGPITLPGGPQGMQGMPFGGPGMGMPPMPGPLSFSILISFIFFVLFIPLKCDTAIRP